MNYFLLLFFGLVPSIVWLLYFLRKDVHPEDNRQVLKIFIYGFLAVGPAALIEYGFLEIIFAVTPSVWKIGLVMFVGVALVEEFLKFLVVREKVMRSLHLDEPVDLPLYLIISSLGFAAAENILVIVSPGLLQITLAKTAALSLLRLVSAVLMHALASGTLGLFLAASFYQPKSQNRLIFLGFFLAVFLHGLYNFSIMVVTGPVRFAVPFLILINLAIVLAIGFKKLSELKSVCKIN